MQMERNYKHISIKIDKVVTSMQSKECMISLFQPNCCIYKVPDYVRKGKEGCYRPLATSIGPIFYNDEELEAMQEYKRFTALAFRIHPDNACQSYEPYVKLVREYETAIRQCYQENISLSSDDFIEMIVLDALFLIYYLLASSKRVDRPSSSTPFYAANKLWLLMKNLTRDLFLEENQLPFAILVAIYNIAFKNVNPDCSFTDLALEFISDVTAKIHGDTAMKSILKSKEITDASNILHLVDLHRMCYYLLRDKQDKEAENLDKENHFHSFPSAKQLCAAGVKFESIQSDNPLHITFNKNNGVLKIPKLSLNDATESILRSILFFEQVHCVAEKRYFTDYMVFLDTLIDTIDDVQVLQKAEIFRNVLGSDEDARDLFNDLLKNTFYDSSDFSILNVTKDLKDYASSKTNKWKAIFWGVYFRHPWAIISVIYAIILLILTVLQTITGFLQI